VNNLEEKTKVTRTSLMAYQALDFLSRGTGKSRIEIEKELYGVLMQLVSRYDTNPFTLKFEYSLFPEPCIKITSEGTSSFVIGEFTEAQLEQMRKERFQKVALTISEINGKSVKVTETKCGLVNCGQHNNQKTKGSN
jgi:hypothetical protein